MKRWLILIVLVVGLPVGGAGYFMYRGYRATAEHHQRFYEAALSGELSRLRAMFSDDLDARIAEADLEAWVGRLQQALGPYQRTTMWGSRSEAHTHDGTTTLDLRARSRFARGEAQTALKIVDDQIEDFTVWSEQMPAWGPGPARIADLREGAEAVLQRLLALEVEGAYELMDPGVAATLPPQEAADILARLLDEHGPFEGMHYLRAGVAGGRHPLLVLNYQVDLAGKRMIGAVEFEFIDRHPLPVGFRFEPVAQGQDDEAPQADG